VSRPYESPLRARQVAATRQRILEAFVAHIVEGSTDPITMAGVAERAGVSLRTVYRHFSTRAALVDAVAEQVKRGMGLDFDAPPATAEEFRAVIRSSMVAALDDEPFQRAKSHSPEAHDLLLREADSRLAWIEQGVADRTGHVPEVVRRRLVATLRVLCSTSALFQMIDLGGMEPAEAIEAIDWSIASLVEAAVDAPQVAGS
jgi:AcrR family transcriptional regulator